jgi:hypothetical protein
VLMCEAEAAIGARSDVLLEVKAARGRQRRVLATVRIPSRRPLPSRHCALCLRAPSVAHRRHFPHISRTLVARLHEAGLVRLTTQEAQERMFYTRMFYTPERMYTPP